MKKFVTLLLLAAAAHAGAQSLSLTSGGAGTTTNVPQSYNETRAADVTVLSSSLTVSSITLGRFCTGSGNGFVGLRVYNAATHSLVFSKDSTVPNMYDGSVTLPASFNLSAGQTYRISFYCFGAANNRSAGSGFMYQPTFPYNDNTGRLRINGAYESIADTFPGNTNIYVPFITLLYKDLSVPGTGCGVALQCYPNPMTTSATLQTGRPLKDATLRLYNACGQLVRQMAHLSGQMVVLQREDLPPGLYHYRLTEGTVSEGTGRLVVSGN